MRGPTSAGPRTNYRHCSPVALSTMRHGDDHHPQAFVDRDIDAVCQFRLIVEQRHSLDQRHAFSMSSHQCVQSAYNRSLCNGESPPECHRTCRTAETLRSNTPMGQVTIGRRVKKRHRNPIPRVRRKRQRLPSSLLIENASARMHVFATRLVCRGVSDEGYRKRGFRPEKTPHVFWRTGKSLVYFLPWSLSDPIGGSKSRVFFELFDQR